MQINPVLSWLKTLGFLCRKKPAGPDIQDQQQQDKGDCILEAGEIRPAPRDSNTPSRIPPANAPHRLPRPPIMAAQNPFNPRIVPIS